MSGPLGHSGGAASAVGGFLEALPSMLESLCDFMQDALIFNHAQNMFVAVACSKGGGTSQSSGSTSGQQSQSSNNNYSGLYFSPWQSSGQYAAAGAPNDPPPNGFGIRKTHEIDEYVEIELRMGVVNARSIRKFLRRQGQRGNELRELLLRNRLDVLAITETWMNESIPVEEVARILPPNYRIFSVPRGFGRGGGVAIVYRSDIECREIRFEETTSFEYVATTLTPPGFGQEALVLNIYRPPSSSFFDFAFEVHLLMSRIYDRYGDRVVIVGDFNVPVNRTDDRMTSRFLEQMRALNLEQFVMEATRGDNTLDLVLAAPGVEIQRVLVERNTFSDHRTILFQANIKLKVHQVKRLRRNDYN